MDSALNIKLDNLKTLIKKYSSAILAFSGGTDSSFLAFVCKEVLGDNLHLITAISAVYPQSELEDARNISALLNVNLELIELDVFDIPEFGSNPPDRCYYCKRELLKKIGQIAEEKKIDAIFDGSNLSDEGDFRPGKKALTELGIISPLSIAGFTKSDIYALSRHFNLPTANKASMACLASRFPYGEAITREKLARVELAEKSLHELGYHQLRIRSHGDLARLELTEEEIQRAFSQRKELISILKKAGFTWCSLDLQGYRSGAMNETL